MDATLSEAVRTGISAATEEMFVARPGKVVSYNPATNTATVKPMVKRALYGLDEEERSFEDLPELPNVPVIFPRAGEYVLTLPVSAGDTVLLVFADVSMAEWRSSGELSEPVDARRHSIGWPVAIPGFFPDVTPMSPSPLDVAARTGGAVLGQDGGASRIEISPTGIKLGANAIDFVALATPTQAGLAACMAAANAAIAGMAALIATFNSHTHLCSAPSVASATPLPQAASGPAAGGAPTAVTALMTKAT